MGLSHLVLLTALLGVQPGSLPEPPPQPEEVLAIPQQLLDRLQDDVIAQGKGADGRLDLLARFIFSGEGLGFRYNNSRTSTVSETYAAGHGNCLSFTLLFLALAEEAGIEADPREVYVPASWLQDGQTLFETGHINVLVETELRRAVVDFEPNPILSRRLSRARRGEVVSLDRALAHFYNNRAAEILSRGDQAAAQEALAWSEAALDLAPEFAPALNNRGVIEQRLGDWHEAKSFFEAALARDSLSASTLFNLLQLSLEREQIAEAERIIARLEELPSDDPYFSWSMGRNYEVLGQLDLARQHYRQALIDNPDNEQFVLDFARINGHSVDATSQSIPSMADIKTESFTKSLQ